MAHWTDASSTTVPVPQEDQINSYYSSILKNRFNVKTTGRFHKIGIVFNALGFNQFIEGNLIDLAPTQIIELHCYDAAFTELCAQVFATSELSTKITLLDTFFLSKLRAEKDGRIQEAVQHVFNLETHRSIEDIAKLMQMDRKTLYKDFKKHLCCSPSAFRRVVMFREAIEQYMNTREHVKLCELAYDNYFYDPSHFTRTTEELTEENPKQFFKGITNVGPFDTYWNFQDESLKETNGT